MGCSSSKPQVVVLKKGTTKDKQVDDVLAKGIEFKGEIDKREKEGKTVVQYQNMDEHDKAQYQEKDKQDEAKFQNIDVHPEGQCQQMNERYKAVYKKMNELDKAQKKKIDQHDDALNPKLHEYDGTLNQKMDKRDETQYQKMEKYNETQCQKMIKNDEVQYLKMDEHDKAEYQNTDEHAKTRYLKVFEHKLAQIQNIDKNDDAPNQIMDEDDGALNRKMEKHDETHYQKTKECDEAQCQNTDKCNETQDQKIIEHNEVQFQKMDEHDKAQYQNMDEHNDVQNQKIEKQDDALNRKMDEYNLTHSHKMNEHDGTQYQKMDEYDETQCQKMDKHDKMKYQKEDEHTNTQNQTTDESAERQYQKIDEHARKAPASLKNSVEDLVNYMSSFSKEPKMLVRGFFVWIAENIRYDVEGFLGTKPKGPNDAVSVMKGGASVCAGYASVMEALCQQANIPVKKITGFSKGGHYSADKTFSFAYEPTHAWNAVQLDGKWYLLDSTWGAGSVNMKVFLKEFNEFYFLTDPRQFINTHFPYFPYTENSEEESKKWQLLEKPVGIDEFSKSIKYTPLAFKLGIHAVSHQNGYIEMKKKLLMKFASSNKEEFFLSGRLMLKEGGWLREQLYATFGVPDKNSYKLLVSPPKAGIYKLNVFGCTATDIEGQLSEVMEYTIKCSEVEEKDCTYPVTSLTAQKERTVLLEPLRGNLPANREVKFKIYAPYLRNIMVGKTFLDKTGEVFSRIVKTGLAGEQLGVFGTRWDRYSKLEGLYRFKIV